MVTLGFAIASGTIAADDAILGVVVEPGEQGLRARAIIDGDDPVHARRLWPAFEMRVPATPTHVLSMRPAVGEHRLDEAADHADHGANSWST